MNKWLFPKVLYLLTAILAGCSLFGPDKKGEDKLTLRFSIKHLVDSLDLVLGTDDYPYTNAAGNSYKVDDLKYILSDIKLHDHDGSVMVHIDRVLYFDAAVDSTLVKEFEVLEPVHYHSLSFVFGLVPEKNESYSQDHTRDIQRLGWPETLGGGYHFMQMNGKHLTADGEVLSLLTHLGRSVNNGETGDAHFKVEGIMVHKTLAEGDELNIVVEMDLNQWYTNPNQYDFNEHLEIMDKPETQLLLRENGMNGVFSANSIGVDEHDPNHH